MFLKIFYTDHSLLVSINFFEFFDSKHFSNSCLPDQREKENISGKWAAGCTENFAQPPPPPPSGHFNGPSLSRRSLQAQLSFSKVRIPHVLMIKTESIKKLSNFYFQWTKTLYQNNLNHIAFFFTFLKGYRYNQLAVITPKAICYGSLRK